VTAVVTALAVAAARAAAAAPVAAAAGGAIAAAAAVPMTAAAATATARLGEALAEVMLARRLLHRAELRAFLALGHALPGAGLALPLLMPLWTLRRVAAARWRMPETGDHVRPARLAAFESGAHRALGIAPAEHLALAAPACP
jgi:hypothetical protein